MQLLVGKGLESLAEKATKTMQRENAIGFKSMGNSSLRIGLSSDPDHMVDVDAMVSPLFVGDSAWSGIDEATAAIEAAFKVNPLAAGYRNIWNPATRKWDRKWSLGSGRPTGDSVIGDAIGPIIEGSLLSPNAISWIAEIFQQPMAWSDAQSLVKIQQGTDPWAEVMNLMVAAYDGWGAVNNAGSPDNVDTQDVEVQAGIMAQPIINMDVTYKLSIQELNYSQQGNNGAPQSGQLLALKQSYANWIMDIMTDALIYYGNSATGNIGLLNVNNVTVWTSVGSNQALSTILADAGNTTKGSTAYRQLAKAIADFVIPLQNNVSRVNVRMSPLAISYLGIMPYSDIYDPNSALKILVENIMAGMGKSGVVPDIVIKADPMLAATVGSVTNLFNSTAHDYLILTAERMDAEVDGKSLSLIWYGMPLQKFAYPVIPQQFSTQYRTLRRVSGVYAPLTLAVKAYSTYGV